MPNPTPRGVLREDLSPEKQSILGTETSDVFLAMGSTRIAGNPNLWIDGCVKPRDTTKITETHGNPTPWRSGWRRAQGTRTFGNL